MTVKDARRGLERASSELENAIMQLVETPTEVAGWPRSLTTALEALQRTRAQCATAQNNESFAPMLQNIQTRVKQVHVLLEAAALFYCGCMAVGATEGDGYTYEGALRQSAGGGRMQLEA